MPSNSPFTGKLSLDEMHVHMQVERQGNFESRIIKAIFRAFGVSTPTLNMYVKRLNAGTASRTYTMDWFNNFAGFPVKLSAVRLHAKRRFSEFLTDFRSDRRFPRSPEVAAIDDLQDGYPGEEVAFICRYPDWGMDLAYHVLDCGTAVDSFQLRRDIGGQVYKIEELGVFLRRSAEAWRPAESLEMGV